MRKAAQSQSPHVTRVKLYAGAGVALLVLLVALHSIAIIALVVAVVGAVAFFVLRARWRWHRAGGNAAMRRRRKFQGMATRREIGRKLSVRAARAKAAVVTPGLDAACAPVVIGRAKGRVIAGARPDSYLVLAPPQTLKTTLISCWAADAPGALLATSSKGDLYRHSTVARARLGEVLVLNADGGRGIPCDFTWSPVEGCENPQTAIRRVGDLMAAAPRSSTGDDAWHLDRGAKLLRYLLHSAAAVGASMRDVKARAHDALSGEPMSILASRGVPGWAEALESLLAHDGDYLASVITAAESALGWMDDPAMAAIACPPPGTGFGARRFVGQGTGSVYLIGEDREHGSLAPYFAALAAELFYQARSVAEESGGRLPIPFTMALDELATIVPVPFHKWTSVAAGHNITLIGGIQSPSQLPERWGEHGARTIRNNCKIKIIGSGFTEPDDLEALSFLCGEADTWHHVRHPDRSKTKQPDRQRLYPPERIRLLAEWHALVLHRNTRPVEAVITPVWDRPGYEPAQPVRAAPAERPAIEAPHREAIAVPYSAPEGPVRQHPRHLAPPDRPGEVPAAPAAQVASLEREEEPARRDPQRVRPRAADRRPP